MKKKAKIIAVIPAYNEEKRISKVLKETKKYIDTVIVVNDGSKDKTAKIVKEHKCILLNNKRNRGYGSASRKGCNLAIRKKADFIATIDADGQHEPKEIPKMIKFLTKNNLEIVFGSRKFNKKMPFYRRIGNLGLTFLNNFLFGIKIKDSQTGFRVFNASIYNKIKWNSKDFAINAELIKNISQKNIKYGEYKIKTIYNDKEPGMTVIDAFKSLYTMFKWKIKKEKTKNRICFITHLYKEKKGGSADIYYLTHALKKKFLITVLTSHTCGSKKYEKDGNIEIYRFSCIFFPDPWNYPITPGVFFHLFKNIFKYKIYIINHYLAFSSLSVFLLKLFRKKIIIEVNAFPGINWHCRSRTVNILAKMYSLTIGRLILRLADKVVLSHRGLIKTAEKLNLNYEVIVKGISADKFKMLGKKRRKNINIAYIGRLDKVKGYDDLIFVAKNIVSFFPKIKFLIVGDNNKRIISNKNIVFLGYQKDIRPILEKTDIYVLPSYAEGLPAALLEAMASGTACIASKVGGIKYLIHEEKNGLLVCPGDKKMLKKKIIRLIKNKSLRKQLGYNARLTVSKDYDINKNYKKYLKIINE